MSNTLIRIDTNITVHICYAMIREHYEHITSVNNTRQQRLNKIAKPQERTFIKHASYSKAVAPEVQLINVKKGKVLLRSGDCLHKLT